MLGLPTPEHQQTGFGELVAARPPEERGEFALPDFVSHFCKQPPPPEAPLQIADRAWSHAGDVMGPPQLFEGRFLAQGPLAPPRGWAQRARTRRVVPRISKAEALRFFEEIGLRPGESLSHEELTWHLRRQPALAARLGQKRVRADELAAFFADMGLDDPHAAVERPAEAAGVPMKEAFRVYQALCAGLPPGAELTHGAIMRGLEMSSELAGALGLLGAVRRPRREERSQAVYRAVFGSDDAPSDAREISMRGFVRAFSGADIAQMGLAVPYEPPARPPLLQLKEAFRLFELLFQGEDPLPFSELVARLRRLDHISDALGLSDRLRRVGGARELYQMMHAEIDDAADRPVDLTLFLRFFAGRDAAAMGLGQQLSETAAASIERPLVPLKTAFSAWRQLEHAAEGATVPAFRPAPCPRPRAT
jgi:hypothetical protein